MTMTMTIYLLVECLSVGGSHSQMSLFDEDHTEMVIFERENFYTDHDYDNDGNDNYDDFNE